MLKFDNDGFSFYEPEKNKSRIFYNDYQTLRERRKFTIAHEIGHIELNHVLESNQNDFFAESEASYFARNFYRPQILLVRNGIVSVKESAMAFKISESYANVIKEKIGKRKGS